MQPIGNQDYKQLLTEVIKKQIVILGPDITLSKARNVKGLTVANDGTVTNVAGAPQEVTQALIDQFVQLSGLIVKKTMEPLLSLSQAPASTGTPSTPEQPTQAPATPAVAPQAPAAEAPTTIPPLQPEVPQPDQQAPKDSATVQPTPTSPTSPMPTQPMQTPSTEPTQPQTPQPAMPAKNPLAA